MRARIANAFLATVAASCFWVVAASAADHVPGERLVVVDPAKLEEAAEDLRKKTGGVVEVVADGIGILKLTLPEGKEQVQIAAADAAATVDGVRSVELNYLGWAAGAPSTRAAAVAPVRVADRANISPGDPRLADQWYLDKIEAYSAWDTRRTASVVVAVIDNGFHYDHEDLTRRWWRNEGETPGNGIDDDGNGYVDDRYGWDFASGDNLSWCETFFDGNQGKTVWESHGSHVAGSICAEAGNGVGISGMAWDVDVMFLRAGATNSGWQAAHVAAAVQYACDNGAKIINCSFGFGGGEAVHRAYMQYAGARGVLVFCAAMNFASDNDSTPYYPAALNEPNQITLANLTDADVLHSSSNWGKTTVHLGAPGSRILSTVPGDNIAARQNAYADFWGTSMATPITAGAAAVVWANEPTMSHLELKRRLLESVDKLSSLSNRCITEGRLNMRKFMGSTLPPQATSITPQFAECVDGKATVTLETRIVDPSDRPFDVQWYVDGNLVKTESSGAGWNHLASLTHEFSHGTHAVAAIAIVTRGTAQYFGGANTTVTVQDTTSPIVVAASDVVVPVDPRKLVATGVGLGVPFVEDACDPAPTLTNDAPTSFPIGETIVTWTVRDADGNVATAQQKVTVINEAPVANAGSRRTIGKPRRRPVTVQLNGTESYDPDDHALTYAWSAPGVTFDDPSSPRPRGKFPLGTTVVNLVVTDEGGAVSEANVEVTFKLRNVTEGRVFGAYANHYADLAFQYGYSSYAAAPGHSMDATAYETCYYAYLYSVYAGDSFRWGKSNNRGKALGEYLTLRYYQYNHSYYGQLYWNQVYGSTGETQALYAAVFSQYALYYAELDLQN